MIRRFSEYIVSWQIKKSILTGEQRAIYLYAYEVFLNYVLNMTVAFLIAIVMRTPLSVFLYLITYLPLRFYGGGYHAKTNARCTVASAILIFMVCLIEKSIPSEFAFALLSVSLVISGVLVFQYAPVSSINKQLDEVETVRYRLRSRQVWLLEAVIGMFFLFINARVCVIFAISHILFSIALVCGMLGKHKE